MRRRICRALTPTVPVPPAVVLYGLQVAELRVRALLRTRPGR